jgi:hypothetical protein
MAYLKTGVILPGGCYNNKATSLIDVQYPALKVEKVCVCSGCLARLKKSSTKDNFKIFLARQDAEKEKQKTKKSSKKVRK